MKSIETVIIGGGQAGLALSRSLTDWRIEHVVLERGRIAERWRSERWDSLRLLTPRWMSRLPGFSYTGDDPDGFMTKDELIQYLEQFASSFPAPIESGVTVTGVRRFNESFLVETDQGSWQAENVVVATGECDQPWVPPFAQGLSGDLHQVVPTRYRNPQDLPQGGVLVVGASATGLQLASEIQASGRPVTLSVGRHTRLPRSYRGKDILWWFDRMGVLDERPHQVRNLRASRTSPSMQLIGTSDHRSVDLGTAMQQGIRLVGRLAAAEDRRLLLADNLVEDIAAADLKLARLRLQIDRFARRTHMDVGIPEPPPFEMIQAPSSPPSIDAAAEGIRTVLWATGFRPSYPWLHVPVLDGRGEIVHEGGVTPCRGLYVMGLRFLRRRSSSFIDGQAKDAEEIAEHMSTLRRGRRAVVA